MPLAVRRAVLAPLFALSASAAAPAPVASAGSVHAPLRPAVRAAAPAPSAPVRSVAETRAAVLAFMAAAKVPSVEVVRSKGGSYTKYENDFAALADYHWKLGETQGAASQGANYYDRAMIYYVWWARTGNPTYLERADALALAARAYLSGTSPLPAGYDPGGFLGNGHRYQPQAYQMMLDGVALHALVHGDAASRDCVARVADYMSGGYFYYVAGADPRKEGEGDSRTSVRVLGALLDAHLLGVRSPAGVDYRAKLRELLPRVLAGQDANGNYPWKNQCGFAKPFMTGMLNDGLIRYYTSVEPDPRIPAAVKKGVDYLWATQWLPDKAAFNYLGGKCGGGSGGDVGPAADLNNMIVSGFEFAAEHARSRAELGAYRDKADAIFAGGVNGTWLQGPKQFNQQYTSSYRFLAMRFGE